MEVPESYFRLVNDDESHSCKDHPDSLCVRLISAARLPSRFGNFIALAFDHNQDKEHAAFAKGDVVGKENVLIRLHSECLTGDAIGSLRCDCRDQLEGALRRIEEEGEGVLLYLRQEGRGIGLTNKLKAYQLQDGGLNTVEANLALGFQDDERDYQLAAEMIKAMGIKSIKLMTNNPNKINQLAKYGIKVVERVGHVLGVNKHNVNYLKTKAEVSGHMINPEDLKSAPISESTR